MSTAPRGGRPQHAPGARRTPFALLVVALIGGGMAALLALNTASAANEVRRHDLADSDQGVAASLVQLQNQVQASAAPDNLAVAAAALGMVPAGNPAFLQIDRYGHVRVLGSAAPASAVPVYVPPKTPSKPTSSPSTSKSRSSSATSAPRSTPSSTPKSSSKSSSSKTPSPNASSSAGPKHGPTHKPKHRPNSRPTGTPTGTPTNPPTPSDTPTPTISLPGGDR